MNMPMNINAFPSKPPWKYYMQIYKPTQFITINHHGQNALLNKMIISVLCVNGMDKYTSYHLSQTSFGSPSGTQNPIVVVQLLRAATFNDIKVL